MLAEFRSIIAPNRNIKCGISVFFLPCYISVKQKRFPTEFYNECFNSKKLYFGLTEGELKKNRIIMTMSNLLKTNFMPTVLPSQVTYEK